MNIKILIIYLISFILLSIFLGGTRKANLNKNNLSEIDFIYHQKIFLRRNFQSSQMAQLLLAYTTGDKKGLHLSIRKAHKNIYLMHLFTPSGIHLSSIFLLFIPLLRLLQNKSRKLYYLLTLCLLLSTLLLPGLFSLKRMAILKSLGLFFKLFHISLPLWWIYLLTFIIDFLFGSFNLSPLSFIYSFLFLGIIICQIDKPKWQFPIGLFGGQLLIGYICNDQINLLGIIFGVLSTAIFSLIYPLFFIYYLLCRIIPTSIGEWPITYFAKLVVNLSKLSNIIPKINASIYLLCALIIFYTIPYKRIKIPLISSLFILHTIAT